MFKSKLFQSLTVIVVLFLLLAWIAGWFVSKTGSDPIELESGSQPDNLHTVTISDLPITYEALGTVRSRTEVVVAARIAGTIGKLFVNEGDRVGAGALIAILNAPEYDEAAEAASGTVEAARAALAQNRRDLARYQELYDRQIITAQQFEQMQTTVNVGEAQLNAALGNAAQAGTMAHYTNIYAVSAGVVAAKHLEVGDVVGPGQPIVTIHDARTLRLEASLDETIATELQLSDTVLLEVEAVGLTQESYIEEIVPQIDQSSRTFIVKAPLTQQPGLHPGMFGRLLFDRGNRPVLLIPNTSLHQNGALDTVQVFSDGRVQTRYVRIGESHGGSVEVLSGLAHGEQIIVNHD